MEDSEFLKFVRDDSEPGAGQPATERSDLPEPRFSLPVGDEPPPQLLTVAQVCSLLAVSRSTLYAKLEKQEIPPPVREGSLPRWLAGDLGHGQIGLKGVWNSSGSD